MVLILFLFFFKLYLHNTRTMSRVSATPDEEASARAAATEANTGAPTMYKPYLAKS